MEEVATSNTVKSLENRCFFYQKKLQTIVAGFNSGKIEDCQRQIRIEV